jgi:hypothetical protein
VDPTIIKSFMQERLTTKEEVARAAHAVGVSTATLYRYKSNPEDMGLGVLAKLKDFLGLPLENGAAWSKARVIETERRRLKLEEFAAKAGGARYTTVAPYTVSSELADVTQILLHADYGTRAPSMESDLLNVRRARAATYNAGSYDSWEIWDGYGYSDFFYGRGRFKDIDATMRKHQVAAFVESSRHPKRHRFVYRSHCPSLPMFGCYQPQGVALVRIEDIHIEFQAPELVQSFMETFDELLGHCITKTMDQFIQFITSPDT